MPSPGRNWTRSEDGWRWGRYRIERLAPRMWVLTCRGADPSQPEIIVTTSASLRVLKHLAERRESRAARRRLLWAHGALAALSTAGLLAVPSLLPSPTVIVAVVALMFLLLRSVAILVATATNGAWTGLRHIYQ